MRGRPLPWQRVHIVGIGGTGLSAIARVLQAQGVSVDGCDRVNGPAVDALTTAGVPVHIGHDPSHVQGVDALLVSSAVPKDHPEVHAARAGGVPVLKRRDILPHILAGREVVAVAGTHGKTTTTAMVVHMMRSAGVDVGYIVGATVPRWGNAAVGTAAPFIIEADEYDYMFWGLEPAVAVVTNVEWDHVDCFATPADYREAFVGFVARARQATVICADDPGARAVAERAEVPVVTFGLAQGNDWTAEVQGTTPQGGVRFRPIRRSTPLPVDIALPVPGRHNVLNALAALAAVDALGLDVMSMASHLHTYPGAGRRFQRKGEVADIVVIDDYAHHPTEVQATLAAARMAYPQRRVWAVFQPHTYSRTRAFLPAWRDAFTDADRVIVMDVYPAREPVDPEISGTTVAAALHHPHVLYGGDEEATVRLLIAHLQPGDVVITLGAGTSVQVAEALVKELRRRRSL